MPNIVEDELVRAEIQDGLSQVDENLIVDEFECAYAAETRTLKVIATIKNKQTSETMEINEVWG